MNKNMKVSSFEINTNTQRQSVVHIAQFRIIENDKTSNHVRILYLGILSVSDVFHCFCKSYTF